MGQCCLSEVLYPASTTEAISIFYLEFFVSLCVAGFLWWSVFEALFPMLWFFPLCALQVSGYEPIILLSLSPLLSLWAPLRQALTTPPALLMLRLLTLVGVASYQSPTPLARLVVLAVGNSFGLLAFISMWWDRSRLDRLADTLTVGLGIIEDTFALCRYLYILRNIGLFSKRTPFQLPLLCALCIAEDTSLSTAPLVS